MSKLKRVYIAGPYSADNVVDVLKNIGRGESAAAYLFSIGFAPFCPWHDKDFIIKNFYRNFKVNEFYDYSMAWLEVSDAILLIGNWQESKGTLLEIKQARKLNIPIFESEQELIEWRNNND
jgi:hypothetical protein